MRLLDELAGRLVPAERQGAKFVSNVVGGSVRIGIVESAAEIDQLAGRLAPRYAAQDWRWAVEGTRTLEEWRQKCAVPSASVIAAAIKQYATAVNPAIEGDYCMGGGLAVVIVGGKRWLEVAEKLAPTDTPSAGEENEMKLC